MEKYIIELLLSMTEDIKKDKASKTYVETIFKDLLFFPKEINKNDKRIVFKTNDDTTLGAVVSKENNCESISIAGKTSNNISKNSVMINEKIEKYSYGTIHSYIEFGKGTNGVYYTIIQENTKKQETAPFIIKTGLFSYSSVTLSMMDQEEREKILSGNINLVDLYKINSNNNQKGLLPDYYNTTVTNINKGKYKTVIYGDLADKKIEATCVNSSKLYHVIYSIDTIPYTLFDYEIQPIVNADSWLNLDLPKDITVFSRMEQFSDSKCQKKVLKK